jgi:outer membrane protein OmpA-like peptidoglycan-associated protein
MKRTSLLLLTLFPFLINAQSLLVNGGFEDINTCTEYKVECAPEAWISSFNSIINFFKDPNRAHTGKNCMTIEAGHDKRPYSRTFIRSRLLCGLRKGNQYRIQFYIKSPYNVFDSMGILFSSIDPLLSKVPFHKLTPAVYLHDIVEPLQIKDSNWYKIEMDYTASGNEVYIALGYFAKKDFKGNNIKEMENRFFVFVDDISMISLDPNEGICSGWQSAKEEIYEENERHEWLEKKLKYQRSYPEPPPVLSKTTYVRIDTLVMPDILFASGKAILQQQSFSLLDSFCRKISSSQTDSVVIEGHTDSTGSLTLNQKLSLDRATAVKNYLESKTGYGMITVRGRAFEKPVADNKTNEGRQKNRRVTIFLYIRE